MTETKPKSPRWMKITLAISLCLNLIVLGAVAGAFLSGGPQKHRKIVGSDPVRGIYRSLPKEVRKSLRQNTRVKGASRKERQEWVQKFVATLRAPGFDASQLETLFATRQERMISIATSGQDALIKAISDMSEQERHQLADDFERGAMRFRQPKK